MNSKEVMKDAVRAVGVLEVAEYLGITGAGLHDQIHDDGHTDLVELFVAFCKQTGNDTTINWVAEQLGGSFVPFVEFHESDLLESTGQIISKALEDLSVQVKVIGRAALSRHISFEEAEKAAVEWKEVKRLMDGFILKVEAALIDSL
jgi:hypothetical protein